MGWVSRVRRAVVFGGARVVGKGRASWRKRQRRRVRKWFMLIFGSSIENISQCGDGGYRM